jgi:hypothetical protein
MEWDVERITEIVKFINAELNKGCTMVSIEKEDFNVNERVIHKRLARLEYKKINNQYTKDDIIQEHNKGITPTISEVHRKVSKVDRIDVFYTQLFFQNTAKKSST